MQRVKLDDLSALTEMQKGEMQATTGGGLVLTPLPGSLLARGKKRPKAPVPIEGWKCWQDPVTGAVTCIKYRIPHLGLE
jgi:hypothetical protein